ncbi:MAG: hypothetical protein KJ558_07705 [Gammaproteobacteria bacterium]|nr:hypothetical protein [Gammaproteobacteria bacterium]MBU1654698.1 hypothetical protein [Gammaproteobacteria bacterium]MBU1961422.1 hypothetical protein [Gammaproteobacteria bacterium]
MHDYDLVQRLIELIHRLYGESAGFLDAPDDPQPWYNRGYANGMVRVLDEAGYNCRLREQVDPDPEDIIENQQPTPWGRAYVHGFEMGERECREALSKE